MRLKNIVADPQCTLSRKKCVTFLVCIAFLVGFSMINILPPDPQVLKDMKVTYDDLWNNWYHVGKTRPDVLLVLFGCGNFDVSPIMYDSDFPCSVILHKCVPDIQSLDCRDESLYYLEFFIRLYPIVEKNPNKYTAIIMAHAHEIAWHHTAVYTEDDEAAPIELPRTSLSKRIKELLSIPNYFESNPFGGLFCHYNTRDAVISPIASEGLAHTFFNMVFEGTETIKQRTEVWPPYPYPCCGTFFFHPKNLLMRPITEYSLIQQGLVNLAHQVRPTHYLRGCGRVLESSWQILLSAPQPAVPPDCKRSINVTKKE